jgi:hypothetical protein
MANSLTQEQFLYRFRERSGPLLMVLNSDIAQYRLRLQELISSHLDADNFDNDIDTGNLEIELIKTAIARIITMVYSDENGDDI